MEQFSNLLQGEQIELHFSARGLKNLNNVLLSDPQVDLFERQKKVLKWIGNTEVVKHNLNPDFQTTIKLTYRFGLRQKLEFQVYDVNESILGKAQQAVMGERSHGDLLGTCKVNLAEIVGARNGLSKLRLKINGEDSGLLIVYADKLREQVESTTILWQWAGYKLKDMDTFSDSDPFAKFYRYNNGQERLLVHQTEIINDNNNPTWKPWQINSDIISREKDEFYVEVYDYDTVGGHNFIGSSDIPLSSITDGDKNSFNLFTATGKNAGQLRLVNKQIHKPQPIIHEITFIDYLKGGWQLSLVVGVDFTFSNLPITKPDSLHKLGDVQNLYQKTLKYVGGQILSYDNDKQVPMFGFGGIPKLPNYHKPYSDDCFPLNGDVHNPSVNALQGLLKAYTEGVPNIEFSGPTFVSNVLKRSKEFGIQNTAKDVYTVVLIMTDGQIEDMDAAMNEIAECSTLAMSIIVIGVGDENFQYMRVLDDVKNIRKHAAESIKDKVRDVTQFVALKDHQNDAQLVSNVVLDNFPNQFMNYMHLNNRQPADQEQIVLSMIEQL